MGQYAEDNLVWLYGHRVCIAEGLEDRCKVNLRYMYLMDSETPSYHCFGDFINEELLEGIEDIFKAVMEYIREADDVDMQHVYIDGTKLEANAN